MKTSLAFLAVSAASPKEAETDASTYGQTYNQIGWQTLFNSIGNTYENYAVSPMSIVGGMYMLGAATTGDARDEIFEVLNISEDEEPLTAYNTVMKGLLAGRDKLYDLKISNGIFHQSDVSVKQTYADSFAELFEGNLHAVDFSHAPVEATEAINEWVSETTNGKIPELYPESLDESTAMVLTSSLYLKAEWQKAFEVVNPEQYCWFLDYDAVRANECMDDVEFMEIEERMHYKKFADGHEVLEIPFESRRVKGERNRLALQLWLPSDETFLTEENQDAEFQQFIQDNIDTVRFDATGNRQMKLRNIRLTMPKFSIDFNGDLIKNLQSQGIETVFSEEADFSPIVGEELGSQIKVGAIDHAVKLDVDENGVEGAAVTSIRTEFRGAMMSKRVEVSRPFYFAISNRCWSNTHKENWHCPYTNVPIFIGKVVNPALV